ncbi:hypothetical protein QP123_11400, partial [Streptococcus agalactiae]|nr:hypothetical protein [Streptococcus agalactiae]
MKSEQKGSSSGQAVTAAAKKKEPSNSKMKWLFVAVIVGVVAGIVVGSIFGERVAGLAFLGSAFVGLIKMMVPAII